MQGRVIVHHDVVLDACLSTALAYPMSAENFFSVFTKVERRYMGVHVDLTRQVAGRRTVFHVPEPYSSRLCARGVATRKEFVRPRTPS